MLLGITGNHESMLGAGPERHGLRCAEVLRRGIAGRGRFDRLLVAVLAVFLQPGLWNSCNSAGQGNDLGRIDVERVADIAVVASAHSDGYAATAHLLGLAPRPRAVAP